MPKFRYSFAGSIAPGEIERAILLAIVNAEALHGECRVRLEAAHFFDAQKRACVIDAETEVGQDLNQLFIGVVRRQFGDDLFRVERLPTKAAPSG